MLALQREMPSSQGIESGRQQQTLFSAGNAGTQRVRIQSPRFFPTLNPVIGCCDARAKTCDALTAFQRALEFARQEPEKRFFGGTNQGTDSEKPADSIPKPRLNRARKFSQAVVTVSSTICCGLKCSRKLLNNSSATLAGVCVSASA